MLTKENILKKLEEDNKIEGQNIMGVDESFYNPYYSLQVYLYRKGIKADTLSERELNNLLGLADFLSEVFF